LGPDLPGRCWPLPELYAAPWAPAENGRFLAVLTDSRSSGGVNYPLLPLLVRGVQAGALAECGCSSPSKHIELGQLEDDVVVGLTAPRTMFANDLDNLVEQGGTLAAPRAKDPASMLERFEG
jgi:hypothetical protein